MTKPTDDSERDLDVSQTWNRHSDEMPSTDLDVQILAAAHRAVGGATQSVGQPARRMVRARRWRIPLAAAATLSVVTLGVLLIRPQQQLERTNAVSQPAASTSAHPVESVPVQQGELQSALRQGASPRVSDAPMAAAAAPARMAAERQKSNGVDEAAQPPAAFAGATRGFAAGTAANAVASAEAAKPSEVDPRVVHIRRLHDDGKLVDAAKELNALRAAVPDADRLLPPELRAWAATVKP
jgi:hypothetical protein